MTEIDEPLQERGIYEYEGPLIPQGPLTLDGVELVSGDRVTLGELGTPSLADRKLDVAVAEKVMRLKVVFDEDKYGEMHIWWVVPTVLGTVADWDKDYLAHYSTDIAAAWLVVEKMHDEWSFDCGDDALSGEWEAQFLKVEEGPRHSGHGRAETAALAICRAALAAVGAA